MKREEAQSIVRSLERFNDLQHKATDEVGWIALRYSCTRTKAERMIAQARELVGASAHSQQGEQA